MMAVSGVEFQQLAESAAETVQIAVRNFNFYYGGFHALKNINLDVYKRRVTAFIGPSGCGKSTLLRTFNRMYALYPEQRAEGDLLLDGVNILADDVDPIELRHRVGMKKSGIWWLSAREGESVVRVVAVLSPDLL